MSKIETLVKQNIENYSANLGVLLMTAATVVGMLELPDHAASANRFILPGQVVRVEASNDLEQLANNPVRRESEETTQRYVSYAQTQRTPSRSTTA